MAFKKGDQRPATSGRKKGSLNKGTILRVSEVLLEKGIDPTERILDLIKSGSLEARDELKAWLELLSYTQSKPKPLDEVTEDQSETDRPLTMDDILELTRDVSPKETKEK